MNPVVQKTYSTIAVVLACVFLYFVGSYISDNGARDKDIRNQLTTLETNQRLLTTQFDGLIKDVAQSQRRIETITGRIANAESGVSEVAGKLADSQKSLTESAGLIDSNERIISAIRQRAESNSSKTQN